MFFFQNPSNGFRNKSTDLDLIFNTSEVWDFQVLCSRSESIAWPPLDFHFWELIKDRGVKSPPCYRDLCLYAAGDTRHAAAGLAGKSTSGGKSNQL